jgi:hypothetical protein
MAAHMKENRIGHALLLVDYSTEHNDHTLGQYVPLLTSCADAVSELSSVNSELTSKNASLSAQAVANGKEISCLKSFQLALFLAVFVLLMVVIVLSSKLS